MESLVFPCPAGEAVLVTYTSKQIESANVLIALCGGYYVNGPNGLAQTDILSMLKLLHFFGFTATASVSTTMVPDSPRICASFVEEYSYCTSVLYVIHKSLRVR